MAAVGGKCETDASEKQNTPVAIHQQMTDAGQFSYGALCALTLRRLFEEDWNRGFNTETLSMILNGLEQPKQVQEAIQAMYRGVGQDDMHPFVDVILKEKALEGDASPVVSELIGFAISRGNYDARMRALIKHVAWRLHIGWDHMEEIEYELADSMTTQKYEMSEEEKSEQEKKAKHRKYKRAALIGLATVTGGTLIGLTGGLAAPLVAAGAGAIIGGAGAAALGSAAGVAIIGSLFGVAGAGLTGYKMKKRVGAIEEFEFEPLISGGPLQLQTIRQQLHITIAITGWIDSKMPDFKQPWQNLAESQEQYTLRWESHYLKDLGLALDYIFNSAVSIATHEALKYTVLSTIMAAITWPAALLSVSQVIDNPWSVALQRAVAAGRQLAEVLLSREQGKRPVTLIGYSLGGRVIFYCLEEMAKRKGCEGIVEDVVVLGAPVTSDPKAWSPFQRVVAGRIINGYCRGDWLLKFLYRTASIQFRIAGLAPVKWTNHRMHNIDLSDVVSGHLDYMKQLDTILRVVGIRVRQRVKVTQKTTLNPTASTTDVASKASSPTKSLNISDTPELLSPSENLNSEDSQTLSTRMTKSTDSSDVTVQDSVDEQHIGEPIVQAATAEREVQPGDNTDQAQSGSSSSSPGTSPSHSIGWKLKNLFSKKKGSTSPAKNMASQREEDMIMINSENDKQAVLTGNEEHCHHDENQMSAGNACTSDISVVSSATDNGPHTNKTEENLKTEIRENEEEKDEKDVTEEKQGTTYLEKQDVENTEKMQRDEKKDDGKSEGKGQVDSVESPVSEGDMEVKTGQGTNHRSENSDDDTYTSSNPCSSPDEENKSF